jgi:hypothetical protein
VPRQLVRASTHDRKRSLGWLATEWMEFFCVHGPGDVQGQPVVHGDEYTGFIVDCYALSSTGRLLYDSAFLSRPKGADKSGIGARFGMFEALGPCRFKGWAKGGEVYRDPWGLGFEHKYKKGEPMGRPVTVPYVRCMATEEDQTGNVYDSILFNLTEGKLAEIPGLDAGLTRTYLPNGGEITPSTASSASKDGGKETFVVFDESHLYNNPELRRMYATVTRNMRKRKKNAGTWYLETTTMFAPGEQSIAEASYALAAAIEEGRTKRQKHLSDHRWGECDDLTDEAALRKAVDEAFGDAVEWNFLDGIIDEFYDPRNDPTDSRRYFLNAPTESSNAWLAEHEWAARRDMLKVVTHQEPIVLGFDGSRKRSRGVTDATALIGCRVRDGHIFQIGVWEQPDGAIGGAWEVPVTAVDATVIDTFRTFNVVGFYADPARWETKVAEWEAKFGAKLKVKSSLPHPIQWWMTGGRASKAAQAIEEFHGAIVDGEMTHDGAGALTRHVLNARNRAGRYGMSIGKEFPDSHRKIDAAVAGSLAWRCRLDAMAKGIGRKTASVRRVR